VWGLISLHQSFTVPADGSDIPFAEWLGATRVGMVDRTSELTRVEISGASHAVGSGLKPFMLFDEFYPTITFSGRAKVTPILSATIHVQSQGLAGNTFVFQEPSTLPSNCMGRRKSERRPLPLPSPALTTWRYWIFRKFAR